MNWSAPEVADVPLAVVTVVSTTPAGSAGAVAEQVVAELQLTAVPAVPPKATVVAPVTKPEPVMVTVVPPVAGPVVGVMAVTEGASVRLWVARADAPPLLEVVWPVKVWVVEVPAESVTVRVVVNGPEVA